MGPCRAPAGAPPPEPPSRYQAYLLRLWRDGPGAPWRASLEPPGGAAPVRFGTVAALFAFLRDQLADPDPPPDPAPAAARRAAPEPVSARLRARALTRRPRRWPAPGASVLTPRPAPDRKGAPDERTRPAPRAPPRPARRAPPRRRRAGRALAVALLLALVLVPGLGAGATPAPGRRRRRRRARPRRPRGPHADADPRRPPGERPGRPAVGVHPGPQRPALRRQDAAVAGRAGRPSAFGSTYTVKPDLSGVSGSTPYADTGVPAGDPSWPLLPVRGRFTDPLHEQALLLSQSNDCAGPGRLHLHAPPGPAGGRGRRAAWPPGSGRCRATRGGSPVAVAAGDLDGRIERAGLPQRRGRRRLPGRRRHPAGGRARLQRRPGGGGGDGPHGGAARHRHRGRRARLARRGGGGLRLGRPERDRRAVAGRRLHGRRRPPCLSVPHLSMLRYTNTGRARSVAVLQADVPLPAALLTGSPAPDMGFQMAVDDFDGQGQDQLAFSFVAQDAALAVLGFARGDEHVHRGPLRPRPRRLRPPSAYCPDARRAPAEAAGCGAPARRRPLLVRRAQRARPGPAPAGPDGAAAGRRAQAASVALQVYDVAFDPTTCAQQPPVPPDAHRPARRQAGGRRRSRGALGGSAARADCCVPPTFSLAAGSFQGLVLNPKDPSQVPWALAVGTSGRPGRPGRERPGGHLLPAVRQPGAGQFTLDTLFQTDVAGPSGDAAAFRLLAYDPAGASLVLGAPLVFTMTGHHVPT